MLTRFHRTGRGRDSSGFVLFVKRARLRREGDISLFVLCAQLHRLAEMERAKIPLDSFSRSCGVGFTGWGGVKLPVDSFYLLSELGRSAMEISVHSCMCSAVWDR